MNEREAATKIAKQLKIAEQALTKAEQIADESGVGFSWSGPTYGMGGYYTPVTKKNDDEDWVSSDEGWQASSYSC